MRILNGHKRDVRAVAFAPDGRLVSGGGDRSVRVWNAATGEGVIIAKAKGPVYAVAASPGGAAVAYGGRFPTVAESNSVHLCGLDGKPLGSRELRFEVNRFEFDGATGEYGSVLRPEARSVWSLSYSADGQYLAAACRRAGGANIPDGGGGLCWALARGAAGSEIPLAENAYAVAFAPTGPRLAVTRYQQATFHEAPGKPDPIGYAFTAMWSPAVAFVPVADLAVVASNSFLYFVNPARQGKPVRVKTGSRTIAALAASPDGRAVLAGGREGRIEVYDPATRARTATYDFGIGGIHALAFSPDGLTFAAGGDTGLVVCDAGD